MFHRTKQRWGMKSLITCLAILLFTFSQTGFAQKYREEEKTFAIDKNGYVSIETYKGSIIVETWDKAEVYIQVKIEADDEGWSNTNPEEQLENVKIKYDASQNSVRIESKYDKNRSFWGSETLALVHYKIKMPKTANLEIDDYKSDTDIKNLQADIKMETYKGRVDITGLAGGVDLETYKGDAKIDFSELKNSCRLETFKGNIELSLPGNSKFDLNIDTDRKGDFDCDFDYSSSGRNREDVVRGSVNGGGHLIEFETSKGDLRIRKK
ncbi:MAG: DUF4097 domain-containing protein [Melioribacteraceae bacterium]|nr:MAG: DUF4097 domain-containing protein [Melioribacteraceae bacterium]